MRAGTATLTTADQVLFNAVSDSGGCRAFRVRNRDTVNDAKVTVEPLHGPTEYLAIPPGEGELFAGDIRKVTAKSSAATVVVDCGIVSMLDNF